LEDFFKFDFFSNFLTEESSLHWGRARHFSRDSVCSMGLPREKSDLSKLEVSDWVVAVTWFRASDPVLLKF
jgi:hypothetical protein